jgi:putative tricarboxylic transport membrane protein
MILGPLAEVHLRRALQMSEGNWMVLLERPISGTIFALTAVLLIAPPIYRRIQKRRNK